MSRSSKFVKGVAESPEQWEPGAYRQTEWTCERQAESSIYCMQVGSDGNPNR